jgi:hypothetical protein
MGDYKDYTSNDYNRTDIDEYTNEDIKLMLSILLFISCFPSLINLTKGILECCKNNYNTFRLPIRKIRSNDNLLLDECSICLETYKVNDKIINLDCSHSFHKDCLKIWLSKNNTCPQCRENII